MQTHSLGNILRVIPLDISEDDFVDEVGFFIRSETDGYIKYCPMNNKSDGEAITKYFYASNIFVDPEICRKIFAAADLAVTSPPSAVESIYIGYGV